MVSSASTPNSPTSGPTNGPTKIRWPDLLIGVQRRLHRHQEAKAKEAETAFAALRPNALKAGNHQCVFCGYRSPKTTQVHHRDNNHHNNVPSNLVCICTLCQPSHHIGDAASPKSVGGLEDGQTGVHTRLFRVPNADAISAQDINHLMRAIAIGLSDPAEAPKARAILGLFADATSTQDMVDAFQSNNPSDMAAAFTYLTQDEYERRGQVLTPVRLLFSPPLLTQIGREIKAEQPAFANPALWAEMLAKPMALVSASGATAGIATGVAGAVAGPSVSEADLAHYQDEDEELDDDD